MLGYNVLVMYLRTIGFFFSIKIYVKNITLGGPHFCERVGVMKSGEKVKLSNTEMLKTQI